MFKIREDISEKQSPGEDSPPGNVNSRQGKMGESSEEDKVTLPSGLFSGNDAYEEVTSFKDVWKFPR